MIAKDVMNKNFLSVSPGDTLAQVYGKFRTKGAYEAVVVDSKKRLVGVLDKKALLRSRIMMSAKVKNFVRAPPKVTTDTDLARVANLMFVSDLKLLPVVDNKKNIIGAVSAWDVVDSLSASLKGRSAGQVGTMNPVVLVEENPIAAAVTMFQRLKIDHAPVVDSNGRLSGIISANDLMTRYHLAAAEGSRTSKSSGPHYGKRGTFGAGKKTDFTRLPVSNFITSVVVTAQPSASASGAAELMRDNRISDVVLVQAGKVVGIVTIKDLLRVVAGLR